MKWSSFCPNSSKIAQVALKLAIVVEGAGIEPAYLTHFQIFQAVCADGRPPFAPSRNGAFLLSIAGIKKELSGQSPGLRLLLFWLSKYR